MTQSLEELDELQWELDDLAYHQVRVLLLVAAVAANRSTTGSWMG